MISRRRLLKLTLLLVTGGIIGWQWYKRRPLPKHDDWQSDFENGRIQLIDDWILSDSEVKTRS